ncbi:MAG: hypothetical protein QM811_21270 [Pirellulales bacterium]
MWLFGRGQPLPAAASPTDKTLFLAPLPAGEPNGPVLAFVEGEAGLAGPLPVIIDDHANVEYAALEKRPEPLALRQAILGTLTGDAVHTVARPRDGQKAVGRRNRRPATRREAVAGLAGLRRTRHAVGLGTGDERARRRLRG